MWLSSQCPQTSLVLSVAGLVERILPERCFRGGDRHVMALSVWFAVLYTGRRPGANSGQTRKLNKIRNALSDPVSDFDETAPWDVLPAANRAVMDSLDYFIVENTVRRGVPVEGRHRAADSTRWSSAKRTAYRRRAWSKSW